MYDVYEYQVELINEPIWAVEQDAFTPTAPTRITTCLDVQPVIYYLANTPHYVRNDGFSTSSVIYFVTSMFRHSSTSIGNGKRKL